jgi:hypothetical protein
MGVVRRFHTRSRHVAIAVVLVAGGLGAAAAVLPDGAGAASTLAVDTTVSTHQGTAAASITSPAFTTHQTNELLVAFLASDGPSPGQMSFANVTGAGLTWTMRARANARPGTAEVWQAYAPATLTNATVKATRVSGTNTGSMVVVAFSGASTHTGAVAVNSAAAGTPTASLTTTTANSWVWGVGEDWSSATTPTPGAGQTLRDTFLAPVGDTYWVQRREAITTTAGTSVTINDIAPSGHIWNLAAVEVLPVSTGPTAPPTAPHVSAAAVDASQVHVTWTASSSAVGISSYQVRRGGVLLRATPNRIYDDTSVSGTKTYTYSVVAVDTQGRASAASNTVSVTTPAATAAQMQLGKWGPVLPYPEVAIHAALTSTGNVLTWQGDFSSGGQQYLFDPTSGTATQVPNAAADLFCAGQAVTADGRIVVIGGTATDGGLGIKDVTAFDPAAGVWRNLAPMHYARWYATGTTLGDGRMLVTSGYDRSSSDIVTIPEVYNVKTNTWADLPTASHSMPVYPFVYQLPDGRVLHAGGSEGPTATEALNLTTQKWTTLDARIIDGASIVNYAPGKFMKAGSASDDGGSGQSVATAFTLDTTQPNPTWKPTGSMALRRSFVNLTALPDGSVLATGGSTDKSGFVEANATLEAELWTPSTGTWRTVAKMTVPRLYHSVAVLLRDGRVFVSGSGGDPGVPNETNAQIYSPPYMFKGPRPTIAVAPVVAKYATTPFITTPDAASITRVQLIRTGSVTHSFDQNSRSMTLAFTRTATGLNVKMPVNGNTAPPGYYMLYIVNSSGVPSIASYIRLPAPYETAPAAPTAPVAVAGVTRAKVSWKAPANNGGSAITGYSVTPYVGTVAQPVRTFASTAVSEVVTGLTTGTTYTFKVAAINAIGTGPPSVASNAVKPT